MGIPRLTPWLTNTFPDAFSGQSVVEADHVYIDTNSVLHDVLNGIDACPDESRFLAAFHRRLDIIFDQLVARRSVFLAVDGPAAAAKIGEQRRRRRSRQKLGASGVVCNMLTPGVPLMTRVADSIEAYFAAQFEAGADGSAPRWPKDGFRTSVSGTDEAGEGEEKILEAILRNGVADNAADDAKASSHAIWGSDSDLFLLPLGPRDSPQHVFVVSRGGGMNPLRVCSIESLCRGIKAQKDELGSAAEVTPTLAALGQALAGCEAAPRPARAPNDELIVRHDFILMCLLRGNDYLPPLLSGQAPENLWQSYLRWRRRNWPESSGGIVSVADGDGPLTLRRAPLGDLATSLGASCPSAADSPEAADGVTSYLQGLLWCLETYTSSTVPDCHYRFPKALDAYACAELLAEHAPKLADSVFISTRRPERKAMRPVTCSLAALPVSDARALVLPSAPQLECLFEPGALLGEVARMESCTECGRLATAAERAKGNKKAKHWKALEVHQSGHSDIDAVCLEALDAEVIRLLDGVAPAIADVAKKAEMADDPAPVTAPAVVECRKRAAPDDLVEEAGVRASSDLGGCEVPADSGQGGKLSKKAKQRARKKAKLELDKT